MKKIFAMFTFMALLSTILMAGNPPTLTYPKSDISLNNPTFTWNGAGSGATHRFMIEEQRNDGGWDRFETTLQGESLNRSLNWNRYYRWQVRDESTSPAGPWSNPAYFHVYRPLGVPVPSYPLSDINVSQTQPEIVLNWGDVNEATWYRVNFETMGPNGWVKASHDVNSSQLALTLRSNSYYRWQVRAAFGSNLSAYSPHKYFHIYKPLSTPQVTYPLNDISVDTSNPLVTLQWHDVDEADSYLVNFETMGSNGWNRQYYYPQNSEEELTLQSNRYYRWQVRARYASNQSSYSTYRYFHTYKTLSPPNMVSPLSDIDTTDANLVWEPVPEAAQYRVIFQENVNGQWQPGTHISHVETGLQYDPGVLEDGGFYRWQVRAEYASNRSVYAAYRYFRVDTGQGVELTAPGLRYPLTDINQTNVNLDWNTVTDATGYQVILERNTGSGWSLVLDNTTGASHMPVTLACNQTYRWKVRATAPDTVGPYSSQVQFETQTPVTIPQPAFPLSDISQTSVTFSWSQIQVADEYELVLETWNGSVWTPETHVVQAVTLDLNLSDGTTYRWKVRARHGCSYSSFSNWRQFGVTVEDQTFTADVANSTALLDEIDNYRNQLNAGVVTHGRININGDIELTARLEMVNVQNLEIIGGLDNNGNPYRMFPSTNFNGSNGQSTFRISVGCRDITLANLVIEGPPVADGRALVVKGANGEVLENILLDGLRLKPPRFPSLSQTYTSIGLFVGNVKGIVVQDMEITPDLSDSFFFYGSGMVLRRVEDFSILNCLISDTRHPQTSGLANNKAGAAISVGNNLIGNVISQNGLILGNRLERIEGQGIIFETAAVNNGMKDFVIEDNVLVDIAKIPELPCIANVDCGGRGIYAGTGTNYLIRGNTIERVAFADSGGGINAANQRVSHLIIEDNIISEVGLPNQLNSHNKYNGFGIAVGGNAEVRGNQVSDCANYGIWVVPGAQELTVADNTLVDNRVYDIYAHAGYITNGDLSPVINDENRLGPITDVLIAGNAVSKSDGLCTGRTCANPSGPSGSSGCPFDHQCVAYVRGGIHISWSEDHADAELSWNTFNLTLTENDIQLPNDYRGIIVAGPNNGGFGNATPFVAVGLSDLALFSGPVTDYFENRDPFVTYALSLPGIRSGPVSRSPYESKPSIADGYDSDDLRSHMADLVFPSSASVGTQ